jgi:hypothetical protein
MPGSENKRDFAARRLPESYEAFVWNDVAIADLRIGRGLYVVEVLVNRRGTKDGALLTSIDTHADPVRLTRPQYALLIGMTAFEQR